MRLAIIGDIHEDIESLVKSLNIIEKNKCDEIICLGDICGFTVPHYNYIATRNASQCLKLVRENCKYVIAGNHDLFAIRKIPNCCEEFEFPENWYKLPFDERKKIAKNHIWLYEDNELSALLNDDDIEFINLLPEFEIIEVDEQKIFLSHYIFPDITGSATNFIYDYNDYIDHEQFITEKGCDMSIFGHVHPDGLLLISNNKVDITANKIKNTSIVKGFSVPCIAQTKQRNGFVIYDTINKSIETIFLKKKFVTTQQQICHRLHRFLKKLSLKSVPYVVREGKIIFL